MAERTSLFAWLQDNARILLSIALVLFLLFAVYSYSKRTSTDNRASIEDDTVQLTTEDSDDLTLDPSVYGGTDEADQVEGENTLVITDHSDENMDTAMGGNNVAPATGANTVEKKDGHITVTAVSGNGMTHLARAAAAEYMTANNVTLTDAQKIYVEDYLVRNTVEQAVHPGTAISFANQTIADAITGAGNMSPALTQYFERCAVSVHF